jgi:cytochrome c6
MKKLVTVTVAMLSLTVLATPGFSDTKKGGKIDGKKEFEEHCAACHPGGKNIVTPAKTLSKKVLVANGVKSEADIVAKMRNPGPGMTKFTPQAVSDPEAKAIAQYIMKTYK